MKNLKQICVVTKKKHIIYLNEYYKVLQLLTFSQVYNQRILINSHFHHLTAYDSLCARNIETSFLRCLVLYAVDLVSHQINIYIPLFVLFDEKFSLSLFFS